MNRWNSNIEIKYGQCVDCPPNTSKPLETKERCPFHQRIHKSKLANDRYKEKKIKMLNAALSVEQPVSKLILWYGDIMLHEEPVCWNCGRRFDFIKKPEYKSLWHAAVAHVLPKSVFRSVKDHKYNYMIMFAGYSGLFCDCHDKWDQYMQNNDWEKLMDMKVWPIALERFRIMEPEIAFEERRLIPKVFLI